MAKKSNFSRRYWNLSGELGWKMTCGVLSGFVDCARGSSQDRDVQFTINKKDLWPSLKKRGYSCLLFFFHSVRVWNAIFHGTNQDVLEFLEILTVGNTFSWKKIFVPKYPSHRLLATYQYTVTIGVTS